MAATGLIASLVNAGFGYLNNLQNQELARQQNQWNRQMWMEQNRYNSPANQMSRLAAAGINPNLAYSNGTMQNTSSELPNMVSSRNMPIQFDPLVVSQANLMDAQAEQARAAAGDLEASAVGRKIANAVADMDYQAMKETFDSGLYQRAYGHRLGSDVAKAKMDNLQYFESAWNLAILFGCSISDLEIAAENEGGIIPKYEGQTSFSFDKESFDKAKKLFVGNQDMQIVIQETEKFMSELQRQIHDKDMDFWTALNNSCEDPDNWFSRFVRLALSFIDRRSGGSLSLGAAKKPILKLLSKLGKK